MSSDYRPRGGGEGGGRSGSGSSGGGRRRRGGRGRSGQGHSHDSGSHSHSHSHDSRSHSHNGANGAPKKKEGFISKLLGIFTGKGKKAEAKTPYKSPAARPDFKEREPQAERTDRPERAERPRREDRPPKAEPTPQEIVSPKLYVGNLAYEAAESDLFDLFSKVGAVKNVEVAMDRRAGRSKGFGFVEMETLETAKLAADKLNRTDFMGRQIVVSGAKLDKHPVQSSQESQPETQADASSHEHEAGGSSSTDSTI